MPGRPPSRKPSLPSPCPTTQLTHINLSLLLPCATDRGDPLVIPFLQPLPLSSAFPASPPGSCCYSGDPMPLLRLSAVQAWAVSSGGTDHRHSRSKSHLSQLVPDRSTPRARSRERHPCPTHVPAIILSPTEPHLVPRIAEATALSLDALLEASRVAHLPAALDARHVTPTIKSAARTPVPHREALAFGLQNPRPGPRPHQHPS